MSYSEDIIKKNKEELSKIDENIKKEKDISKKEILINRKAFLEKQIPDSEFKQKYTSVKGHFSWRLFIILGFVITIVVIATIVLLSNK